jgi:hypothetical protein
MHDCPGRIEDTDGTKYLCELPTGHEGAHAAPSVNVYGRDTPRQLTLPAVRFCLGSPYCMADPSGELSRSHHPDCLEIRELMQGLEDRLVDMRLVIGAEIAQLRQWAIESLNGGWSTHQVRPMRARADELETMLAQMARKAVASEKVASRRRPAGVCVHAHEFN